MAEKDIYTPAVMESVWALQDAAATLRDVVGDRFGSVVVTGRGGVVVRDDLNNTVILVAAEPIHPNLPNTGLL